jgi:hypothetical protein
MMMIMMMKAKRRDNRKWKEVISPTPMGKYRDVFVISNNDLATLIVG